MLRLLHIKDFAIIDELEVWFGPGLNIMTGETGAGKTIVVEALKLILGERSNTDAIRAGKEKAIVSATFDMKEAPPELKKQLEDAGIDCSEELVISRVVGNQGKGRIAINGMPVTGAYLKKISAHLVDVSSQHEHQMLLETAFHSLILDEFGDLGGLSSKYREHHSAWSKASRELCELKANEKALKDKLDFLKFQLQELKAANLKPGEDAEIEAERKKLKHANALEEKMRLAETCIYGGENSAVEMTGRALQLVSHCEEFDAGVAKWRDALNRARVEMEEAARDIARYIEGLEANPLKLLELDERLHLIRHLMRKHGGTTELCLARQKELEDEINTALNYDDVVKEKTKFVDNLALLRREAAKTLTEKRKKAAEKMGRQVETELAHLQMAKAKFVLDVRARDESEWDDEGADSIEFLISPNVGEPAKSLARIASGGELSRVMLALKGALAGRAGFAMTSVFDEVDSGIGGAVAEVVGRKLKSVSVSRQVICITHLPQIAVHGDHHLGISKRVESSRTVASFEILDKGTRVKEIARMLGGTKITAATTAHAQEMLKLALGS